MREVSRGMYLGFWIFLCWTTLCCGRGIVDCFAWKTLSLRGVRDARSSWDELLRSLRYNLASVCSLVLCFRKSSLIVFKYCDHFTFGKSFFTGLC